MWTVSGILRLIQKELKTLVVIVGPTASGKTTAAIHTALHFGAPVLSCDSRQFYREIPIGTAAPTVEEREGIPHFFVGNRSVTEPYSCGTYETEALQVLKEIFRSREIAVMVGGSGLYADAVCSGMDEIPSVHPEIRAHINHRFVTEGLGPLLRDLEQMDPDYYASVDRSNSARVIRALEVFLASGKPFSSFRTGEKKQRFFRIIKVGINREREKLYRTIDERVEKMVASGMVEEARSVHHLRHLSSLRTVGFSEWFDHFEGKTDFSTAVELIKRNTRRYAKRQLTWFGKDQEIQWFDFEEIEKIPDYVTRTLSSFRNTPG